MSITRRRCLTLAQFHASVGLASLGLATPVQAQGPTCPLAFAPRVDYQAAGQLPTVVRVSEFNDDGIPDLVTGAGSSNLTVLLGRPAPDSGTFELASIVPTSALTQWLEVGDLNADGHADIAAPLFNTNTIAIVLGNGDGTFQTAVNYPAIASASRVCIADLNSDGHPDLVAGRSAIGTNLAILLGNGDGTFQAPATFDLDTGTNNSPRAIEAADLNADGHVDLIVGKSLGGIAVMLGHGDGTFEPASTITTLSSPYALAIGDLNADGVPDLVVAIAHPFVLQNDSAVVLLGVGDGTFQPGVSYTAGRAPRSVIIGDFNGDMTPDMGIANQSDGTVSILRGNGDGTFLSAVQIPSGLDPQSVAAADFNTDGHLDFTTAGIVSKVSVMLNFPAPVITLQPQPLQVVNTGDAVSLGVVVDTFGAHITYQWRRNGTVVIDAGHISGATTPTLTINPATGTDTDTYDVVITRSSPCNPSSVMTTSETGVLAVRHSAACAADVDDGTGSGTPDGGVTIDDLLYFLSRFNLGC